jgi:hypothetical protein
MPRPAPRPLGAFRRFHLVRPEGAGQHRVLLVGLDEVVQSGVGAEVAVVAIVVRLGVGFPHGI